MRHLILCCALFTGSVTIVSAADDGAFGALVRKPANSVCVFDGNAVDPSKQPVEIAGANQPVLVGACSEACLNKLHGMLGANGYAVAAAATNNTTLAKMQTAAPAGLPAPTSVGAPAPGPVVQTQGPGPIVTHLPAPAPVDRGFTPAPGKQETFGKAHNEPKTVEPAPVDDTSPAHAKAAPKKDKPVSNISNLRGDESDERQREKKAAQRRDAGKPADDSANGKASDKTSEKHADKTEKKKSTKPRSEHPAEAPTEPAPLDNGFQR